MISKYPYDHFVAFFCIVGTRSRAIAEYQYLCLPQTVRGNSYEYRNAASILGWRWGAVQ